MATIQLKQHGGQIIELDVPDDIASLSYRWHPKDKEKKSLNESVVSLATLSRAPKDVLEALKPHVSDETRKGIKEDFLKGKLNIAGYLKLAKAYGIGSKEDWEAAKGKASKMREKKKKQKEGE